MFYYDISLSPLCDSRKTKGIVEGADFVKAVETLVEEYGLNIEAINHLEYIDCDGEGKAVEIKELKSFLEGFNINIQDNTNRPEYDDSAF